MASTQPLTTYLTTSCPLSLKAATESPPFLHAAATGCIPKQTLSQWLSQDRLYAQCYIRFIGLLLSKVRLPPHNPDSSKPKTLTVEHRAVDILIEALVNIQRELKFFEAVAVECGLDLTAIPADEVDECACGSTCLGGRGREKGCTVFFGPSLITRAYMDLFISAGSSAVTVLEGMVVLWATEVCYLKAWKHARAVAEEKAGCDCSKDADGGILRTKFIPNWTSPEFEDFVNRIRDVVDEMAGQVKGAEEGEMVRGKCLEWWRQILWLEEKFWPSLKTGKC